MTFKYKKQMRIKLNSLNQNFEIFYLLFEQTCWTKSDSSEGNILEKHEHITFFIRWKDFY